MSNNKQSSVDKEFVPYEEALALKQLGFNEPCLSYWGLDEDSNVILETRSVSQNGDLAKKSCTAPTYSQAFRWFREKYKLQTYIDFYHSQSYFYKIKSQEGKVIGKTGDVILQGTPLFTRTYEEAELACLRRLIEIRKRGGNNEQEQ